MGTSESGAAAKGNSDRKSPRNHGVHAIAASVPPPGRVNEIEPHVGRVPLQSPAPVQSAVHCKTPPPIGRQIAVAQSLDFVHVAPKPSAPVGVGPQLKSTRFAPEFDDA
jgi:hypothetical protein